MLTMLASPGEVGHMHIKIEPQEEEPLVSLQRQNAEWMERCLELDAKVLVLEADNKKLRESWREGNGEERNWKERGQ